MNHLELYKQEVEDINLSIDTLEDIRRRKEKDFERFFLLSKKEENRLELATIENELHYYRQLKKVIVKKIEECKKNDGKLLNIVCE